MSDSVMTYDGHAAAVRPRAFEWEGRRYVVAEVLAQARTVEGKTFRVRTADNQVFDLVYAIPTDTWRIQPR